MYAFLFNGIDFSSLIWIISKKKKEKRNLTSSQKKLNEQLTYLNQFECNFWQIFLVDIELRIKWK